MTTEAGGPCAGSGRRWRCASIGAVLVFASVGCATRVVAATQHDERNEELVQVAEQFVAELIKSAHEIVSRNLDLAFEENRRTRRSAARSPVGASGADHVPSSDHTARVPSGGSILVRAASRAESASVASAVPELEFLFRRHFDWSAIRDIVSAGLEYELGYVPLSGRDVEEEIAQEYARLLRSVLFFYSGEEVFKLDSSQIHPNGDVTVHLELSSPTVRPINLRVRVRSAVGRQPLVLDIGHEDLSILQVARAREFEKWLARTRPRSSSEGTAAPRHE